MRQALSEKHVQRISSEVGIPYETIYARGGGISLIGWRDHRNADQIIRRSRQKIVAVCAEIRNGQVVHGTEICWGDPSFRKRKRRDKLWTFLVENRVVSVVTSGYPNELPWKYLPWDEYTITDMAYIDDLITRAKKFP